MDAHLEKKHLEESVFIEPEIRAEAALLLKDATRRIAISDSPLSNIIIGMCHVVITRDPNFSTFAVMLLGDGNPVLAVNPDFILKLTPREMQFALMHEAYHLILRHLFADPHLRFSDNWTTATEACINYRVSKLIDNDPFNGEFIKAGGEDVMIIHPRKVFEQYRTGMKNENKTPVGREDFFKTDMNAFYELERLDKPVKPKNNSCVHSKPEDGEGGSGGSGDMFDQSETDKFVQGALDKAFQQAIRNKRNGNDTAAKELMDLIEATPEFAEQWGDMGAGELRGEVVATKKTDLWEKWTSDIIGQRMQEGTAWRYNKKIPWDARVSARGKLPKKYGSVFVDASGSMQQEVLDKVRALCSTLENIDIEWHSFDGEVWPFHEDEAFRGGGGTSFQIIEDHVQGESFKHDSDDECCQEELDFVLVITDGWAPHIHPSDPDKWIWLITPGGEEWPAEAGMNCRVIDLP